jgi:hypothetical protein
MITAIDGQSGAGMMHAHIGFQPMPDFVLVDLDGRYFRGFMLGRPAVTADKFAALVYSEKLAVKVAEKLAVMYGSYFLAKAARAEGAPLAGKSAGGPESVSNLPVGNHGDNN